MTDPTKGTVATVVARDFGRCAKCGIEVHGQRGMNWSVHHRCPRSQGGTSREWVNLPGNLILLHGSGTTGCHFFVESNREWATNAGFLVSANGILIATQVAIDHAVHGVVYLTDNGGFRPLEPGEGYAA